VDNLKIQKTAAHNERFHASGGADSSDTEQVSSFALVRALPMPPPAWSRHHVIGKARATVHCLGVFFAKYDNAAKYRW